MAGLTLAATSLTATLLWLDASPDTTNARKTGLDRALAHDWGRARASDPTASGAASCHFDEQKLQTRGEADQPLNWYSCKVSRADLDQSSFAVYEAGDLHGLLGLVDYVEYRALYRPIIVPELAPDSELSRVGLRSGDEIVHLDGIGERELDVVVVTLFRGSELRQHVYEII